MRVRGYELFAPLARRLAFFVTPYMTSRSTACSDHGLFSYFRYVVRYPAAPVPSSRFSPSDFLQISISLLFSLDRQICCFFRLLLYDKVFFSSRCLHTLDCFRGSLSMLGGEPLFRISCPPPACVPVSEYSHFFPPFFLLAVLPLLATKMTPLYFSLRCV